MNKLSPVRFGLATGITWALLYAGCVVAKAVVPTETEIRISNSLLHGIDVTTILRNEMPISDMLVGVSGSFVLGLILGGVLAVVYNAVPGTVTRAASGSSAPHGI